MKSPFHIKKYDSYDSYIEHQYSKLNKKLSNPHGEAWLRRHENNYGEIIKLFIGKVQSKLGFNFSGNSCLCVGARGEVEVKAFIDVGCLAIGIDLNPTPNNCYVVSGDVSRIQYPDNSFDIVYTNALDHFLLIDTALENIGRVLKPDGIFFLVTGTPDGAKNDAYGSTYWDSQDALEKYLYERHKFRIIGKSDINKATKGWFSHVVILSNKKDVV